MVGYAGSRGYDLVKRDRRKSGRYQYRQADGSLFFPGERARRQNPAWETASTYRKIRRALHVPRAPDRAWMKRYKGNYQIQLSYTLSRAMDNGDAQLAAGRTRLRRPSIRRSRTIWSAEWAAAAVRRPACLRGQRDVGAPVLRGGVPSPSAAGSLNGSCRCTAGYPFSPSIQTPNWSRTGNISNNAEDRPNVKPGTDPGRWSRVTRMAGSTPARSNCRCRELSATRHGTSSAARASRTVDMSLVKNQVLRGDTRLQIRLEAVERAQSRELRHADAAGLRGRESE